MPKITIKNRKARSSHKSSSRWLPSLDMATCSRRLKMNAALSHASSSRIRRARSIVLPPKHLNKLLYVIFLFLNLLQLAESEPQNTYTGYYPGYALDSLPVISIDDNAPYDLDVIHSNEISNSSTPVWHQLDCLANQNAEGFADRAPTSDASKLRWVNQKLWKVTWFSFHNFDDEISSGTPVHNSKYTRVNEDGTISLHEDLLKISAAKSAKDTIYFECELEYVGHRRQSLEKIRKTQFPFETLTSKRDERQTGWATSKRQLPKAKYSRSSCNKFHDASKCPRMRKKIVWRSRRARFRVRAPEHRPKVTCYNDMMRHPNDTLSFLPKVKECEAIYENSAFVLDCTLENQNYESSEAIWFVNGTRLETPKFAFQYAKMEENNFLEMFIVNGRIHVNRAIKNNTEFTCQLLGKTSDAFTTRLTPFPFERPLFCDDEMMPKNAAIDCFFPGVLDAHNTSFTLESIEGYNYMTINAFHRVRAGQAFALELLCQPCALTENNPRAYFTPNNEIFFNESLHQHLYDPRVNQFEEQIYYRDAKTFDDDDSNIFEYETRQLLSPIIDDLNLRNLKADNEVMFRESVLANLRLQDRSLDFNLGQAIKYFGQSTELNYKSLVQILAVPDVLMQYRTFKEMENFEKSFNTRSFADLDISQWSKRAEYELVQEETVLTCHIQGQNIENWKFEWLHDGKPITNRDYKLSLRKARKITDNRGKNDIDRAKLLCDVFNNGDEKAIVDCMAEQKLFGLLPDEAVEILPQFDPDMSSDGVSSSFVDVCDDFDGSEENEACIKMKYMNLKYRYARMDLHIPPSKARGSYQCRVTSDNEVEGSVIRTFVFFDGHDSYYTPAALSLVHDWRPRKSYDARNVFPAKFSDISHHIQPMKLRCALYGIDSDDIRRFDYSAMHSAIRGNMMREPGHWPFFLWNQNGQPFVPGMGNRLYRHQDDSYIFQSDTLADPTSRNGRWEPVPYDDMDDMNKPWVWKTDKSMSHLASRVNNTDKAMIVSELLLSDFSHSDEGTYECSFDQTRAQVQTPNAENKGKKEAFPLLMEHAEASIPDLNEEVGIKIKWSVPFQVCDELSARDCDEAILSRGLFTQDLRQKQTDYFWRSFENSDTRFYLMLYPRRESPDQTFAPPPAQNPALQIEIAKPSGSHNLIFERIQHPESAIIGHYDCYRDRLRCGVDRKYIWADCEKLESIHDQLECDRYRRAQRTRIVCSCLFRDPASMSERDFGRRGRFQYGVDYEVQVRMKKGKVDLSTGFEFSEYLVAHHRPIVRVTVPSNPEELGEFFEPAKIDMEESNVIIDGIARVKWFYDFEHPSNYLMKQKFHPNVATQTLVWGTLSQHLKVRVELEPNARFVDIGPFSPFENFTYVVHLETTYVSVPEVSKKSRNFFINSDNIGRYERCEGSRRGAPVKDLWSALDDTSSSLNVRYRVPTINRNEYVRAHVYTATQDGTKNFTQVTHLNPGKVDPEIITGIDRTSLRVCDVSYSKRQSLNIVLSRQMERSFALTMHIYDFKKIQSQPAHNILLNPADGKFEAIILPKCDMVITTPIEKPHAKESNLQELSWICPNRTSIALFGAQEAARTRKRSSLWKQTDELSFIQQLKQLDYLQFLWFDLRWSFISDHGNWKYHQIPFERMVDLKTNKLDNILGTIGQPFTYKWTKPTLPVTARPTCDKIVVSVQMFLKNPVNVRSREKITSEYSNEVSFAAQDEDNLTPLTAVVHHHGKLNEIRIVPDEAPQQYCSQETYIQIRIKKINENGDNKNATEWTGCSILSSTTSENELIRITKMYNKGVRKPVKEIIGKSNECAYEFITRRAVKKSPRANRQKVDREQCLDEDEFEKSSDWTRWAAIGFPQNANPGCKPKIVPVPQTKELITPNSGIIPPALEDPCDFKFKGFCLNPKIVLAVFVVVVVLVILVLVCFYICLCKESFSRREETRNRNSATPLYPGNQLHDGTITAKPFKDDNCSRQEESLLLLPTLRFAPEICPDTPVLDDESPPELHDSESEKRESTFIPSCSPTPSEKETSLHLPIRDEIALLATSVGESFPSSRNSLSDSCCESTSSSEELVNLTKAHDIDKKNVHKDNSAVQEMYPRILPNSLGASTPNRRHCPG